MCIIVFCLYICILFIFVCVDIYIDADINAVMTKSVLHIE